MRKERLQEMARLARETELFDLLRDDVRRRWESAPMDRWPQLKWELEAINQLEGVISAYCHE